MANRPFTVAVRRERFQIAARDAAVQPVELRAPAPPIGRRGGIATLGRLRGESLEHSRIRRRKSRALGVDPLLELRHVFEIDVLEERPTVQSRGFLQHFDKTLNVTKTPGAFGWDDTPSVVPSSAVKAYHGTSKYLILAKYNNYAGDARLLHVFPAEVNAVQLEQQLPAIREPRRRFSPILTAMLEDRGTVDLFILAYLYRLLRLEDSGGVNGSRWVLFVPASPIRGEERFALTPGCRYRP